MSCGSCGGREQVHHESLQRDGSRLGAMDISQRTDMMIDIMRKVEATRGVGATSREERRREGRSVSFCDEAGRCGLQHDRSCAWQTCGRRTWSNLDLDTHAPDVRTTGRKHIRLCGHQLATSVQQRSSRCPEDTALVENSYGTLPVYSRQADDISTFRHFGTCPRFGLSIPRIRLAATRERAEPVLRKPESNGIKACTKLAQLRSNGPDQLRPVFQ